MLNVPYSYNRGYRKLAGFSIFQIPRFDRIFLSKNRYSIARAVILKMGAKILRSLEKTYELVRSNVPQGRRF